MLSPIHGVINIKMNILKSKQQKKTEMKLLKIMIFLNNREESYFEDTFSGFSNDPFRTYPPGFSNV